MKTIKRINQVLKIPGPVSMNTGTFLKVYLRAPQSITGLLLMTCSKNIPGLSCHCLLLIFQQSKASFHLFRTSLILIRVPWCRDTRVEVKDQDWCWTHELSPVDFPLQKGSELLWFNFVFKQKQLFPFNLNISLMQIRSSKPTVNSMNVNACAQIIWVLLHLLREPMNQYVLI